MEAGGSRALRSSGADVDENETRTQDEFDRLNVVTQSVPHERVHGAYLAARRERLFELRAVEEPHSDRRLEVRPCVNSLYLYAVEEDFYVWPPISLRLCLLLALHARQQGCAAQRSGARVQLRLSLFQVSERGCKVVIR